ncbi:MAG: serine/threonine protein kinase, partial [Myxococcaceae bacterium]|nr:serine/threonine protein kinase [Myxococcaceae bacterium]
MPTGDTTLPSPGLRGDDGSVGARVGRYEVSAKLGSGGMGTVWSARDPVLQRTVAVKVMRFATSDAPSLGRFEREARAMAALSHPNVVPVFDFGVHDGQPYLVMELVRGPSLRAWLRENDGRTWAELLPMLTAAARGLAAAHRAGLVHRDFKPDNVLVHEDGRVLVTDFGLVRSVGDVVREGGAAASDVPLSPEPHLTATHALLGTPGYMSPEQLAGEPLDARSDQFSFGVVLYEALWGVRPFEGETPLQLSTNIVQGHLKRPPDGHVVPKNVEAVVMRALRPYAAERFESMDALIGALDAAATPPRPRRTWLFAAAAFVAVATALATGAVMNRGPGAADAAVREGIALWRGGSSGPALRRFERAPGDARAALWAAFVATEPKVARAHFATAQLGASALDEDDAALLRALAPGMTLQPALGTWLDVVNAELTARPKQAPLLVLRAGIHARRGANDEALADARAAARLDPALEPVAAALEGSVEH